MRLTRGRGGLTSRLPHRDEVLSHATIKIRSRCTRVPLNPRPPAPAAPVAFVVAKLARSMSAEPRPSRPALTFLHETPQDQDAIEALLDRAFGPGRFVKCSERVREFAEFAPELSFCAWGQDRLLGVVRMWRVRVGETPVTFLGPLAVDTDRRSAGVGGMLVERACKAAETAGERAVLLVGDGPYFARFGFAAAPAKAVRMPAPVDQRRVLVRAFSDLGDSLHGAVEAR